MGNVALAPGDARSFGGGNETINGSPIRIGLEPTEATGRMYHYDQGTIIGDMRKLESERLEVLFVNEAGQLAYNSKGTAATVYGFPVDLRSFQIKDMNVGDRSTPPYNDFVFNMPSLWSSGLKLSAATSFLLTQGNT
jgi:hypothetical protein